MTRNFATGLCYARALPLLLLLCSPGSALATCYEQAATRYQVNAQLLKAIAKVESSENPNAININRQFKSYNEDIGLMQINSRWLPELRSYGIQREHLFDACVNANIGAWILAKQIQTHGNTWKAVGAYHSATPALNQKYAQRVYSQLKKDGVLQ